MPDENRPSWRPQDEGSRARRDMSEEDSRRAQRREFGDEERFASRERERMGSQWDDRSARWDDREESGRSTEYYGQGQSGYAAGRYESDRSYGSRNEMNPHGNERYPDRGGDERFTGGRGGGAWRPEDRSMRQQHPGGGGYGQGREGWGNQTNYGNPGSSMSNVGGRYGDQGNYRQSDEGGYLGQGGQQMGYGGRDRGERGDMHGGGGVRDQGGMYGQGGYNDGMYGRGGMQNRYGSQGYQGWGQQGQQSPGHRGKGPSGYTRSDDRIREIVCEVLMDDDHIDATNIEVSVKSGEVTLSGTVEDRAQKRMAEDRIEGLSCVKDVVNQLRVGSADRSRSSSSSSSSSGSSTNRENGHSETSSSSDKRHRA